MLALIQYNFVTLVAAFLIGLATGWWAYNGRSGQADRSDRQKED